MDLATLQGYLAQAQQAYHELMMGQSLVKIRHNEREMSYGQANKATLAAYIADLNGQIATLQAGGTVTGRRGRSRSVFF